MPAGVFRGRERRGRRQSPWPDFAPDVLPDQLLHAAGSQKWACIRTGTSGIFHPADCHGFLGDSAGFPDRRLRKRTGPTQAVVVRSGDILIMGGASRMRFHGIRKTYPGTSPIPRPGVAASA